MKSLYSTLIEQITNQHLGLIVWVCPETPKNIAGGLGQVSTYVPAVLAQQGWFILQVGRGNPAEELQTNRIILRDSFMPDQIYPKGQDKEEVAIHSLAGFFEKISKELIKFMIEVREARTNIASTFPFILLAHDHFSEPAVMRVLDRLKEEGMKIIFEVHNEVLGAHLGYLLSEKPHVHSNILVREAKKAVQKNFRHLREISIFERFKEGKIDILLSVSDAMLSHYTQAYELPEGNKHRAPNGIPADEFFPAPNQKIQTNLIRGKLGTCLWIGRPVPEKGLTQLFSELPDEYRAFIALGLNSYVRSLVKKNSDEKKILLITPDQSKEIDPRVKIDTVTITNQAPTREQFKEVLETYNFALYDIVLFAFWMPKVDILSNTTVFVGNSSYEPSGIIQLEATACGTPSIISKQLTKDGYPRSGMTEYYPNTKGVLAIYPEEFGALASALGKFLESTFFTEKRKEALELRDQITWEYVGKTFWLNFLANFLEK